MKLTITIDGNNLDNMFDVCQHLADNLFDGNLEVTDFEDYDGDPVVEVEYDDNVDYDDEQEYESDEPDYDGERCDAMRKDGEA